MEYNRRLCVVVVVLLDMQASIASSVKANRPFGDKTTSAPEPIQQSLL